MFTYQQLLSALWSTALTAVVIHLPSMLALGAVISQHLPLWTKCICHQINNFWEEKIEKCENFTHENMMSLYPSIRYYHWLFSERSMLNGHSACAKISIRIPHVIPKIHKKSQILCNTLDQLVSSAYQASMIIVFSHNRYI